MGTSFRVLNIIMFGFRVYHYHILNLSVIGLKQIWQIFPP